MAHRQGEVSAWSQRETAGVERAGHIHVFRFLWKITDHSA